YYIQDRAIKWRDNRLVRLEIATDITQIKKTEQALKQAKEKAERSNKAKNIFLANMSHELRTPLNSILGFNELIMRHKSHDSTTQDYLNTIHKNGEHLLSLINDIIDLSKIEENQTVLNQRKIHFHTFLDDIKNTMMPSAQEKDLTLFFNLENNLAQYIRVDDVKLKQILINLISNAIKFTDKGHIEINVRSEYQLKQADNHIQLFFDVIDTGIGICDDKPEMLFDIFTQSTLHKAATQNSAGLGLNICKKFVHLMGGDIGVKKQSAKGAHFFFHIPVIAVESEDRKIDKKQVVSLAPDQGSFKILVVDDIASNRNYLLSSLKPVGFDVQEAENGQKALDIWKEWQPDLIWLDIFMPVIDGFEVVKKIRKMESENQHVIIIAVSASSYEEDRHIAINSGCDDFLLKPFSLNNMFHLMASHLNISYVYKKLQNEERKNILLSDDAIKRIILNMPKSFQKDLKNAVNMLDSFKTKQLIQVIEKQDALAGNILMDSIKNYNFSYILSLL
ncbi:two-component hybrid sensor and regulator, partial [Candidatus Magnetomorum sp. HK-1]